jgi:hypothetical protein
LFEVGDAKRLDLIEERIGRIKARNDSDPGSQTFECAAIARLDTFNYADDDVHIAECAAEPPHGADQAECL